MNFALDFSVISGQIPFHIKVVLVQFLSKNNLEYLFLKYSDLLIEKVTNFIS